MKNSNSFFSAILLSFTSILIFPLLYGCKDPVEQQVTIQEEQFTAKAEDSPEAKEDGGEPWVLDIEEATVANVHYRIEQWTGKYMQMVLMSIKPGEEIDLEIHENHDQFIRIEQGEARILMGKTKEDLSFDETVQDDWAIFIPAGYYHNVKNIGEEDLKIYTIYTPKEHPEGTLHSTYKEAQAAHQGEH